MKPNIANISIMYLRTFVAVVEGRSYKGAALILGRSHNSLATHIKNLEETLGGPLMQKFHRQGKLTDLGKIVYEKAKLLVQINDDLILETRDIK
jgi:DNA-binding transcriptional LysR family regulator